VYASASEVVRAGLRLLIERDEASRRSSLVGAEARAYGSVELAVIWLLIVATVLALLINLAS
jgi:hypothetical protein